MSYLIIDDFRLGMDRRKERVAGVPGALWAAVNGHITRGGDFQRRKKFVQKYALPTGKTFGLAQVNTQLFTFGSAASPGTIPAGITYQRLAHPSTANMIQVLDVTTFNAQLYVVAQFDDGSIYHYYNGARVTAWDALATFSSSAAGNAAIAAALARKISLDPRYLASSIGSVVTIIASTAGTAFTISSSATDGGSGGSPTLVTATPQANVSGSAETPSQIALTVSGTYGQALRAFTIGGVAYFAEVDWSGTNAITAGAIAAAINAAGTTIGITAWSATSSSNVVTISAPAGLGASANGTAYADTGNMSSIPASGTSSGGVNAVAAVAQVSTLTVGGTYGILNLFSVTIDSVVYNTTALAAGMGFTALTYMGKVYSVAGSLLYFCNINDPTAWNGTGSGFINMTNQDANSEGLVGICQFQGRMAIFSRFNTQLWVLAVDPANNTFQQSIQNTGALSGRSLLQYGNIDTFYLSDTGVRSMRARDASNAPAVSDVGVSIDTFIQSWITTLSGLQIGKACAVIEPVDGRYWTALNNRIFVYTFFEGSKIQAWTYYDLSDEIGVHDVEALVRAGKRLYLRASDSVYLYGGDSGSVYPNDNEILCTLGLPFLSAGKPGTVKGVKDFDVGLTGVWEAYLQPDPTDDTILVDIGTFSKSTYNINKNPIEAPCVMAAVQMVCSRGGYASISNMLIHFDSEDEK